MIVYVYIGRKDEGFYYEGQSKEDNNDGVWSSQLGKMKDFIEGQTNQNTQDVKNERFLISMDYF